MMLTKIKFALTFDDGPGPFTNDLLEVLREYGAKATFFILGENLEKPSWSNSDRKKARAIVIRAMKEGHVVGNHTYSHSLCLKPDVFMNEVRRCDSLIQSLRREAGLPKSLPIPLRLPYGINTLKINGLTIFFDQRLSCLKRMRRRHIEWTGDFQDWRLRSRRGGLKLSEQMKTHVLEVVKRRRVPVMCLHNGSSKHEKNKYDGKNTVIAVDYFLKYAKHYHWKSVVCSLKNNRLKWH